MSFCLTRRACTVANQWEPWPECCRASGQAFLGWAEKLPAELQIASFLSNTYRLWDSGSLTRIRLNKLKADMVMWYTPMAHVKNSRWYAYWLPCHHNARHGNWQTPVSEVKCSTKLKFLSNKARSRGGGKRCIQHLVYIPKWIDAW